MNRNNISNEKIKGLMNEASKKTGIDIAKMKAAADSGKLDDFIGKNLSSDAAKNIQSVLSDKSRAEKLLNTPEAKELLKKLMKD